jgi:class 3 adenylate cyclase/streptogramin lyase
MRRRSAAGRRFLATVLFTDIVGSTDIATELGDRRWRELLARHHSIIRRELKRFGGKEIDTAGDGFFATFEAPAEGVRCACAASEALQDLGIDIRAGLHVGECELMGKKVGGIAVHTGARVLSASGAGEVLVTSTAKDLVAGSRIDFKDHGVHQLKGIPGEWRLFVVTAVDGHERPAHLEPESAIHIRETIEPAPLLARRRGSIAAAVAVLIVAAGIGGVVITRGGGTIVPGINVVGEIPAGSDGFSREIAVGGTPIGVAAGEGSIWVINEADGTITRIDPNASDPVVATKSTFGAPTGIAAGEGATWISTGFGTAGGSSSKLYRFDPASNEVTSASDLPAGTQAVAVGDAAVWVGDRLNGQVLRFDPKTNRIDRIRVGPQPIAIAIGDGNQAPVWVADGLDARVWRIDPATGKADPFDVAAVPSGLAVDGLGNVWVTSSAGNSITRLDTTGNTVTTITAGVPAGPAAVVVVGDNVWVAGAVSHEVVRIDAATNRVVQTLFVTGSPSGLAADPNGDVWVTVRSD